MGRSNCRRLPWKECTTLTPTLTRERGMKPEQRRRFFQETT